MGVSGYLLVFALAALVGLLTDRRAMTVKFSEL